MVVCEAFQNGAPLELAIAELGAAKAEAEARRQAEALASQPSSLQPSAPPQPGIREGKPTDETGYYVSSLRTGAKTLLRTIRQQGLLEVASPIGSGDVSKLLIGPAALRDRDSDHSFNGHSIPLGYFYRPVLWVPI